MIKTFLFCYVAVAAMLFIIGITFGMVLKKDILHGGMKLGIINSALLSSLWPITFICILCGFGYEAIQVCKRI